ALVVIVGRVARLTAVATAATAAPAAATKVATPATPHATAATAVEHLHLVGDDLGGVAVVAGLVLPLARAQRAFDVDLGTLFQVLAGDLTETAEHGHVVPFGTFLVLTRLL